MTGHLLSVHWENPSRDVTDGLSEHSHRFSPHQL